MLVLVHVGYGQQLWLPGPSSRSNTAIPSICTQTESPVICMAPLISSVCLMTEDRYVTSMEVCADSPVQCTGVQDTQQYALQLTGEGLLVVVSHDYSSSL